MIGYATLGTKDLDKALAFYESLLALVGGKQLMGLDRIKFYGTEAGGAMPDMPSEGCLATNADRPGRVRLA